MAEKQEQISWYRWFGIFCIVAGEVGFFASYTMGYFNLDIRYLLPMVVSAGIMVGGMCLAFDNWGD